MSYQNICKCGFLVLAFGMVSSLSAADQVAVLLKIDTTHVWDGVRGPTEVTGGTSTQPLVLGESSLLYFALGAFDDSGKLIPDTYQFGDHESFRTKSPTQAYADVWTVECTPLSVNGDVVELEIGWHHHRSTKSGPVSVVDHDTYRVALSEGQRNVVACIPAPASSKKMVNYLIFVSPKTIATDLPVDSAPTS